MPTPLETEIAKPIYAALTDAQTAAQLNAPIVIGRKPVPLADFVYLVLRDYAAAWAALQQAAMTWIPATDQEKQIKAAAVVTYDYLRSPHVEHLDMDLPATKAVYGALVAGGIFPQGLIDAIDALANSTTTRGKQLRWFRPITAADVAKARAAK